jgi:hypothetical protein
MCENRGVRIIGVIALSAVAACWKQPAPQSVSNGTTAAPAAIRCKTAVERLSQRIDLRPKDVTMAIGECEQQEWSAAARECVAGAHSEDDLDKCATTHHFTQGGIFAARMTTGRAFAALRRFKDEMCQCQDAACAQRVSEEMTKWGEEQAKDAVEPPRMTDDESKAATEIGMKMGECMQRAMGVPATP